MCLQSITAEVAKVVPKAASLKFEDVADPTIIEKLEKNGFIGQPLQIATGPLCLTARSEP